MMVSQGFQGFMDFGPRIASSRKKKSSIKTHFLLKHIFIFNSFPIISGAEQIKGFDDFAQFFSFSSAFSNSRGANKNKKLISERPVCNP